jgi:cytochrome P450
MRLSRKGRERRSSVTVTAPDGVYYDSYDVQINADPYLAFKALREGAPLYYNEQHDFYALSRFADVDRAIVDHETFSSARGAIIELIKANIDIPPGVVIFEDPPIHDVHRKLLARMFTPRKINDLEPKIREFCARSLDPLVGSDRFDFVAGLGAQMPMRVIGMLLGVPEEYQEAARDLTNAQLRTEAGKPMQAAADGMNSGEYPLLPRLGAGPTGGADCTRGDLEAIPRVGSRPQHRHVVSDIHRAWLGGNAGASSLRQNTNEMR